MERKHMSTTLYIGDFNAYINNHKFILKNVHYSKFINKNLISINQ